MIHWILATAVAMVSALAMRSYYSATTQTSFWQVGLAAGQSLSFLHSMQRASWHIGRSAGHEVSLAHSAHCPSLQNGVGRDAVGCTDAAHTLGRGQITNGLVRSAPSIRSASRMTSQIAPADGGDGAAVRARHALGTLPISNDAKGRSRTAVGIGKTGDALAGRGTTERLGRTCAVGVALASDASPRLRVANHVLRTRVDRARSVASVIAWKTGRRARGAIGVAGADFAAPENAAWLPSGARGVTRARGAAERRVAHLGRFTATFAQPSGACGHWPPTCRCCCRTTRTR